jgi:hypothetical protein
MTTPSFPYLRRAFVWLSVTTALYLLMNGAQVFETLVIVPVWSAGPPASLGMFQGAYALDFKAFWIAFHSIHEIIFIAALVFCWRLKDIRRWLVLLLAVHIAVRVWTVAYFAPTIISFQQMVASPAVDPALVQKAGQWRLLNMVRVLLFFAVNLALVPLLARVARQLCASHGRRSEPATSATPSG